MKSLAPCVTLLLLSAPAAAQEWAEVSAIFEERCIFCHSGEVAPLGLRLDSHEGLMAGSENGPVVDPENVRSSALYQRITGEAEPRMPLDGPPFLDEGETALITDWIAIGAPGPDAETAPPPVVPADPFEDGQILYGEVARIFGQACIECHSDNGKFPSPPEGLRLDSYDAILAGGERLAVIPGNAQASELIRRVEGLSSPRMPFDGPPWLGEEEIALLRAWIDGGARSDNGTDAPMPVGGRIRLRGVLTAPDAIDGAAFIVTGGTRIDERPPVGGAAELRARVGPDGELLAERLRER